MNIDLSVYAMNKSSTVLWGNNNRNTNMDSRHRKILHDPECENQCCLKDFYMTSQSSNYYKNSEHLLNDLIYADGTDTSSTTSNNQFLNDVNTYSAQVPEYPDDLGRNVDNNIDIPSSHSFYLVQVKANLRTKDAERNQKSDCKGVVKRKRQRTIFTTQQIIAMEGVFKKRPYVSGEERLFLTKKLNVSEKAIKVWFQNRRRMTEKREKEQTDSCHSDSTNEEMYDTLSARLDYIESQIKENTDEYGFVTLDNKTISELAKIIDTILSRGINNDDCLNEKNILNKIQNTQSESYLLYEPISPESLPEDSRESENILKWRPSKPEESLQRLIDIHSKCSI